MCRSFVYLLAVVVVGNAIMASRDVRSANSGWQGIGGYGGGFPTNGATRTANQWASGRSPFGLQSNGGFPSDGNWGASGRTSKRGYGDVRSLSSGWTDNSEGWVGSGAPNNWGSSNSAARSSSWQTSGW